MDCPKSHCGGQGEVCNYATDADVRQARGAGPLGKEHPLLALGSLAFMGAKYLFSQTYKCQRCGHIWRKWG